MLRTEPLPRPSEPAEPTGHDLRWDAVVFRRGDRTVLDGLDLSVPQGQRLAVVGPSGAGKSTLLHLLARFHDVDAGAVRIGGVDVRQLSTETLMARIALVFQDVYLFDYSAGVDANGRFRGRTVPTGVRPSFTDRFQDLGIKISPAAFGGEDWGLFK